MGRSKWSLWRRMWLLFERGSRTVETSLAMSPRRWVFPTSVRPSPSRPSKSAWVPPLVVTNLSVSPATINVGDNVTVTGGFTETGTGAVGPHTAQINYGDGTMRTRSVWPEIPSASDPLAAYTFNSSSTLTADSSGNAKT